VTYSSHPMSTDKVDITSIRPLVTDPLALRNLRRESAAEATRRLHVQWVRHPDGFNIFVPEGGEQFFDLIKNAILRKPFIFARGELWTRDIWSLLSLPELEALEAWLDSMIIRLCPLGSNPVLPQNTLLRWVKDMSSHLGDYLDKRRAYLQEHGEDDFECKNVEIPA
jgi:hypothetical protein